MFFFVFFFFQAEDGIRDLTVTGVQTCALPISFLTMAIGAGLTSAIMNPMHLEIVKACMAADVMMGHDPDCARWIRRFREAPALQASGAAAAATPEGAARGRREGGHRRRAHSPS